MELTIKQQRQKVLSAVSFHLERLRWLYKEEEDPTECTIINRIAYLLEDLEN